MVSALQNMVEEYNNDHFAGQRTACAQNSPNKLPSSKFRVFQLSPPHRDLNHKTPITGTILGHSWEMLGNLYISPLKKLPLPLSFQGKPWKPAIFDNGGHPSSTGKALQVDANERQHASGNGGLNAGPLAYAGKPNTGPGFHKIHVVGK